MVSSPVDSSMRSRQTGHVGSSIRAGVGGGAGLVRVREVDIVEEEGFVAGAGWVTEVPGEGEELRAIEGVKGSFVISGKEEASPDGLGGSRNEIDLTKTT